MSLDQAIYIYWPAFQLWVYTFEAHFQCIIYSGNITGNIPEMLGKHFSC